MAADREKVAILGGGVGALCAAVALSEIDPKGERFDITVYQLGWRLGGKCAAGRNAAYGQRIEEHGLHVWAGFYDNAFTVMRVVCNELKLPLDQLFERQNLICFAEKEGARKDRRGPWPDWYQPGRDPGAFPGRDSLWAHPENPMPPLPTLVRRTIATVMFNLDSIWHHWPGDQEAETRAAIAKLPAAQQSRLANHPVPNAGKSHHPLLELARRVGAGLEHEVQQVRHEAAHDVAGLLHAFHDLAKPHCGVGRVLEDLAELPAMFRHALTVGNLAICVLLGIVRKGCLENGLEAIDDLEFREFLTEQDAAAAHNEVVTVLYEYLFAFEGGSRATPRVSACTAVQGLLRLFLTYRGAFFFKGLRSMGDLLCTPIYTLLKQRGVTFKFFHKVVELQPTADGLEIGTILVDRQAAIVGDADYDPLVPVQGFDCWPSTPRWEQLRDGAELRDEGINFESSYPPHAQRDPVARLELKRGQDFDTVILGISVGALGRICKPLVDAKPAWAEMVEKLATVRTQALQLWVDEAVDTLCPDYVAPKDMQLPDRGNMGPIVATCRPPLDTYADMSQLLPAEDWPAPAPRSVAYFCAVLDETAPNDGKLASEAVKDGVRDWMTSWLHNLWPGIGQGADFRWDLLHAPDGLTGEARLDAQFWRANIDPTERYVLSLPGTLKYRMEPGQSGYGNLYLAGDWTRVPEINAGCVEVAAMSGLLAASALSGVHIPVVAGSQEVRPATGYIDYGGWITLPPAPSSGRDTSFYSFPFTADKAACQGFLDRSYNLAAGYTRFRAMLDLVFLNIVQVEKTGALVPPYDTEGFMPETDIGFWLLVGSYKPHALLPEAIGWVPAYLFVDNAWTTLSGREIWGLPKYVATMDLPPAGPASAGPFAVSALAIRNFRPTAQAQVQPVLKLTGTQMKVLQLDDIARTAWDAAAALESFKRLCAAADGGLLQDLLDRPGMPPFIGAGIKGFPVYYLKQARTADSATAACYRALLQGPLTLTGLHDAGLLDGSWTLEMEALDSLPFIRDLGLGTPKDGRLAVTARTGFWGRIDFEIGMAAPMA
ncbi:MAG: NAD(P)-binding protein [Sneathiellaceae bacterium]